MKCDLSQCLSICFPWCCTIVRPFVSMVGKVSVFARSEIRVLKSR